MMGILKEFQAHSKNDLNADLYVLKSVFFEEILKSSYSSLHVELSLKFQFARLMIQVGGESNTYGFCLVVFFFSIFLKAKAGVTFIIAWKIPGPRPYDSRESKIIIPEPAVQTI